MLRYKGHVYRTAAAAAVIDDAYWRREKLMFWIVAVMEAKMAENLPAKSKKLTAKTWDKMPEVVKTGVGADADVQQAILDCVERDSCHLITLEGGWDPGVKNGQKDVEVIHNTLALIEQFRDKTPARGLRVIWAEINSQVKK